MAQKGMPNFLLARKTGLSGKTIYSAMHGKTKPQNETIAKIAEALGAKAAYLLEGETGGLRLKESSVEYETHEETMGIGPPKLIHDAVVLIAEHMAIPKHELMDAICELAKKKLAETKSKAG